MANQKVRHGWVQGKLLILGFLGRREVQFWKLIVSTPDKQDMDQMCNCPLDSDYLEFKRHVFGEALSLKEWIANNTKFLSEEKSEVAGKYDQKYIRNLQERIYSLERQLEEKQTVIEKHCWT